MATNTRTIRKISIDPDSRDTIIQFVGNSSAIEAKALDFKMHDGDNIICYWTGWCIRMKKARLSISKTRKCATKPQEIINVMKKILRWRGLK